eukprot:SAG31_NODE_1706_length_7491_cov_1.948593_5_plen_147_part_00
MSFQKSKNAKGIPVAETKAEHYTVSVLLRADATSAKPRPAPLGIGGEMLVIPVYLTAVSRLLLALESLDHTNLYIWLSICSFPHLQVSAFSQVRIHLPNDLRSREARQVVGQNLDSVLHMPDFKEGLPELDLVKDMKIKVLGVPSC